MTLDEEDIYAYIAAKVIRQAVQDLRWNEKLRKDAKLFFESDQFLYLCSILGIDPEYIRKIKSDLSFPISHRDKVV